MGRINFVKGILDYTDDIEDFLDRILNIPADVQIKMLKAQGEIIAEAEKSTALTMLQGPYTDVDTGVAQSIKVGKMKKSRADTMYHTDVIFEGTQHGERLATIAFVNEYGALHAGRGSLNGEPHIQPPRPFVTTAIYQASGDAVEAAHKIFMDDFINK